MKLNFSKLAKHAKIWATRYTPEILTGVGIAGMITTIVLSVRETPKAIRLIDEKKDELEVEKLPAVEIVKTTWKCYIPAALTGTASVFCLIGANSVSNKRMAALTAAYKISETAFTEYKEKVVETVGEKKEKAIRDAIDKDRLEKDPVSKKEVYITGKGDTLCYDAHFGRYFKSDIETIRKAANNLNAKMLNGDMYVALNDFYAEIDLDPTSSGDELGWNVEDGLIDIVFGAQIADDGTPCITIDYTVAPKYDYYKFN